jgi:branched-chain amino acid transport system permease protein
LSLSPPAQGGRARPGGHPIICLALALIALLGLTSCGAGVDRERARICRLAIPALNAPGSRIEVLAVGSDALPRSVVTHYRVHRDGRQPLERKVICRFAADASSTSAAQLVGIATEAGPVADGRFYFLVRFYLSSPEAFAADPGPGATERRPPEGPRWLAELVQHIVLGLPKAATYALLAGAYALVYGLVGRLNLAFGELTAFGAAGLVTGVAAATVSMVEPALGLALGLFAALFLSAIHGAVGGWFAIVLPGRAGGHAVLIATVGLSLTLMEYLRLARGAGPQWVQPVWATTTPLLTSGDYSAVVTPIALAVAGTGAIAAACLLALLKFTTFGRSWRAYAEDATAATLLGIDGRRLLIVTLALSSGLAGLAGFLMVLQFGTLGFADGFTLGLKALVAAVVGGIGSVPGALIGGVMVAAFEIGWSALFPIAGRDVALYVALAALLALRPGGLLGWSEGGPRQI